MKTPDERLQEAARRYDPEVDRHLLAYERAERARRRKRRASYGVFLVAFVLTFVVFYLLVR